MKRLLVTGASGLLGINLARRLSDRVEVFGVLRRERPAAGANLPFRPLYGDLADLGVTERLIDQAEPDAIIHCAAMANVDSCEQHPAEARLINAAVPEAWAAAAARRGIPIVHISTDAVFDGTGEIYREADTPSPINVYARTKLEGERRVAQANPGALITRVNFYGWSWEGTRSLSEYFFHNLAAGRAVRGFTNITFCPLLVDDLVETLWRMLQLRLNGLYHVVAGECLSKYEFGVLLARRFGFDESLISPSSFQVGDLDAPRAEKLNLSSEKLAAAIGQAMPRIAQPLDTFYQQYCEGYPAAIRSLLVRAA